MLVWTTCGTGFIPETFSAETRSIFYQNFDAIMNIELFTLCDGAFNYNGKLTIVGTLSNVGVSEIPARLNIGVGVKLRLDPFETVGNKLGIMFYNPDGTKIPIDVNVDLDSKLTEEISYIALAVNIQGLPINQLGLHNAKLLLEEKEVAQYSFKLEQKDGNVNEL